MKSWRLYVTKHQQPLVLCVILVSTLTISTGQIVRTFPPLFNMALNKAVSTHPTDSTCGLPTRNAYCESTTSVKSIKTCTQAYCVQTCPERTALPSYDDLLSSVDLGTCVTMDNFNTRPGSASRESSISFYEIGENCFITSRSNALQFGSSGSFTLTLWFWLDNMENGTLIEKMTGSGDLILRVLVSEDGFSLNYNGSSDSHYLFIPEAFPLSTWTFLGLQVFDTSFSYFLNGVGPGMMATGTETLLTHIQDEPGSVKIGQSVNGDQFRGRIQDFRLYSQTLSNRDIQEVFSGVLPKVRIQSSCRCPPTHPRVRPLQTHYCIRNGVPDNTADAILRLNSEAHPLEYINDGDSNSIWISMFQNDVEVTVDLGDDYQVFYVGMQFYSPQSKAIVIERQTVGSPSWQAWQRYAKDCLAFFSMDNNGQLLSPTAVNCLQMDSVENAGYSMENITFNMLSPPPIARPGYDDFYGTPGLFDFVLASKVRLSFTEHYHVIASQHMYFGLYEIYVEARCDCNGHAEECDTSITPYQCSCSAASYTDGNKCEKCLPLYNDKPFRRGDLTNAFDCWPCICYNHSASCVYNASLDPFPESHDTGGGGMCVDCQHNTVGQKCDSCDVSYYVRQDRRMNDVDVCELCSCNESGVTNNNMECDKLGGQCSCKAFVGRRQCDACQPGYFNLQLDNLAGCDECLCNIDGTVSGLITCNADTGQCSCKRNVKDLKCDSCQYGFYGMNSSNSLGCSACDCNPIGSTSQFCDPISGQCVCKVNVADRKCDQCENGYFDFESGCLPCTCNLLGTEAGTYCNKQSGQCVCQLNTQGANCDECKDGAYSFGSDVTFGCQLCNCNPSGALNGSLFCNKTTGECGCKSSVIGLSCNQCRASNWGLSKDDPDGCSPCNCDPSGTNLGGQIAAEELTCDQNSGSCACLTNRLHQKCDDCIPGFFISPVPGGGCLPCQCHPKGSVFSTVCDSQTGQCICQPGRAGVTGRTCAECYPGYFNFNDNLGNCTWCNCLPAGSANISCHSAMGKCECKSFVTALKCTQCIDGASNMMADNPYGCSKTPSQQPQPSHVTLSDTEIQLSWYPPDEPNGVILQYILYRDSVEIGTFPSDNASFSSIVYNDTGLSPYTVYTYTVEAFNDHGTTLSTPALFRTLAGTPKGELTLLVTNIRARTATFNWNVPIKPNGPIEHYTLTSSRENQTDTVHWEGQNLTTSLSDLDPFTFYSFVVSACTVSGCLVGVPVNVTTISALPQGLTSAAVIAISNSELYVEWEHPTQPNGIIIFYELWMRGAEDSTGTRQPVESRIFHPSGQYNPRQDSIDNALPPPANNYTVAGLSPFTVYEFQVLAENDAGKVASAWVSAKTLEAAPVFTPSPDVVGISSYDLTLSWAPPLPQEARGMIIAYRVYHLVSTDLTADPFAPPFIWQLRQLMTGNERAMAISELLPYSLHTFKIGACNSVSCVNSTESQGRTIAAVPEGVQKPNIDGINSTAISITWPPPDYLYGPAPEYTLEKMATALNYPPRVVQGTRFPGGGYYTFPPETLPQNVEFTGIRFWFRTKQKDGLLLYAASGGQQEEFVAIQIRSGRPWFIFDPQGCVSFLEPDPSVDGNITYDDGEWHHVAVKRVLSASEILLDYEIKGCAVFATTTDDEGRSYSDGVWYHMRVKRMARRGFIFTTMQSGLQYSGSSNKRLTCATGNITGPNTGVHVGGLPYDYLFRRVEKDSRARIVRQSFQGCIKDFEILKQEFPEEVWEKLEWSKAVSMQLAFLNWEGCPTNLERGIHFLGKGFCRFPDSYSAYGNEFIVSFAFRTEMREGLFFFVHGSPGSYIVASLTTYGLVMEYKSAMMKSGRTITYSNAGINFCDGTWQDVMFQKLGNQLTISVTNVGTVVAGNAGMDANISISSELYIGGIPQNSQVEIFVQENGLVMPSEGFGGCMSSLKVNGVKMDFLTTAVEVVNVNMDGCPPLQVTNNTCQQTLTTPIYAGYQNEAIDKGLKPYTEYIYRVTATNEAGTGIGPWSHGRTKEGAPTGVLAPYKAVAESGYLIQVHWKEPTSSSGLLTRYVLRAYHVKQPASDPLDTVILDTAQFAENITNAVPFTEYLIKLVACTSGGCTESATGTPVTTLEEVPGLVPAPTAEAGPSYLLINWGPPGKPNGVVTGYMLYVNKVRLYMGGETHYNVTNLQVYTGYDVYIKGCSRVGCTDGPTLKLTTSQLPPASVNPAALTVLGPRRIEARWNEPVIINGILERYLLYLAIESGSVGLVLYNNSDLFRDYVLTNLTAGVEYYVTLVACTGGGCTTSEQSNATTVESAPEDLALPIIDSPSSSEIVVTWDEPGLPNGVIIEYNLYHNGLLVYTHPSVREYRTSRLLPYSLHIFRVSACTNQGCGFSDEVQGRTQESPPLGYVVLDLRVEGGRNIGVKWSAPATTNGRMIYSVYADGLFYVDPESYDYTTVYDQRIVLQIETYGDWASIGSLIPLSHYSVHVNASNSKGHILSNTREAIMPMGSPDGVQPPTLDSTSPYSITATWQPVGRVNANEQPSYVLQFREKTATAIIEDIFGPTAVTTYTKTGLKPFTEYDLRIVAGNSFGQTRSMWVQEVTRQASPEYLDPPLISNIAARAIDIVWTPPLQPNGIITEYNVYHNGAKTVKVSSDATTARITGLQPYQFCLFMVEACTLGGCTTSGTSMQIRTLQAVSDGLSVPVVSSSTPTSVLISWSEPSNPNGAISQYVIERALKDSAAVITLASFPPAGSKVYMDESAALTPHTTYMYRVKVLNGAGYTDSSWAEVTTLSSRPGGVLTPIVKVTGSRSLWISWEPPLMPNGQIDFYVISLPEPRFEVRNVSELSLDVTDLVPYTTYSVTLEVCTDGGCTESFPVSVTTDPDVPEGQVPPRGVSVSQSIISLIWQPPAEPNGPNIRYELSRLKTNEPLNSFASGLGIWQTIFISTDTVYEDRGLTMLTTFQYRVTVFNEFGQITSPASELVTTYGGVPTQAASVSVTIIDHQSMEVNWVTPSVTTLQGYVEVFTVRAVPDKMITVTKEYGPGNTAALLTELIPNTQYSVTVTIRINGGASISSDPVAARTIDGAPLGLAAPVLRVVSEMALQVAWSAPKQPNGQVTGYYIYKDGQKIDPQMTLPGSFIIYDLLPYTVYAIQVEACTIFSCTRSNATLGTTAEARPQGVAAPDVLVLDAFSTSILWRIPDSPNGIILKYELWRKITKPCSQVPVPTVNPETTKCSYVTCSALERVCGASCYSGSNLVCCDGVLHEWNLQSACCGMLYILQQNPTDVCCDGMFYPQKDDFQCCGSRYTRVLPGEACCPDSREDRVLVGVGDACCGDLPFSSVGAQICCAGQLYDGYGQHCCGGVMVSSMFVCCGTEMTGLLFSQQSGFVCCGLEYVNADLARCCRSDTGHEKAHIYTNLIVKQTSNEKCCGLGMISSLLQCCNYVGYNANSHVCADISSQDTGCGIGTVCSLNQQMTAYCDRCDFNKNSHICASVSTNPVQIVTNVTGQPTDLCTTDVSVIYSGMKFAYTDAGLAPYTQYDYSVRVLNSVGETSSDYVPVRTLETIPSGVDPPDAKVHPQQLDVIYLTWSEPGQGNGDIIRYILRRDSLELYRGTLMSYTDNSNILPYRTYSYTVSACTQNGCTESLPTIVATAESAPGGLVAPTLQALSSRSIRITWKSPTDPNGILTQTSVVIPVSGVIHNETAGQREFIVRNLEPFSEHFFLMRACTLAGCMDSDIRSVRTLAAAPQGVFQPTFIIISSDTLQLFWREPSIPNGDILTYSVFQAAAGGNAVLVYSGPSNVFSTLLSGLTPGSVYRFSIETATSAGSAESTAAVVTMPTATPLSPPVPKTVTAISSTEIQVTWDPMVTSIGNIDQYRVLVLGGPQEVIERGVGLSSEALVSGLSPYTEYTVRIRACFSGATNGCGTGTAATVTTKEAAPQGQLPPRLTAQGPRSIDIVWSPPEFANGIITGFSIHHRKVGALIQLLINHVSGNVLGFTHSGRDLLPYTEYEYTVTAVNAQGSAQSSWTTIRTLEDVPQQLSDPTVQSLGAFSVSASWPSPILANGIITAYKVEYTEEVNDPTFVLSPKYVTVWFDVFSVVVGGLSPFTQYLFKVIAINGVGNVTSSGVTVTTGESSPAGLGLFTIDKISTGQAVILRWPAPLKPYGIITTYRIFELDVDGSIYQGLNQVFEMRRLLPYTVYSVTLEACTAVGCTKGSRQSFTTTEILPSAQQTPAIGSMNATHVTLTWSPPANPNGQILSYEVLRRSNSRIQKRSLTAPVVVYKTTDTSPNFYQFVDSGLQPYTEYQYMIRAGNSRGSTDSPWQVVTTDQAPPEGVSTPIVTHISDRLDALFITWNIPSKLNGIIQNYQLQRNKTVPFSFQADDTREYIDSGLRAYTWYSYAITVCTGGGCTTSIPTLLRTKEAAPLYVAPPDVIPISSTAVRATWVKPQITNGNIKEYGLLMDGLIIYTGLDLQHEEGGLIPYQEYAFILTACTDGGCTDSVRTLERPEEDVPLGLLVPVLRVMSSRSIDVNWQTPEAPNGVITSYDVRRDGQLVYTESITTAGVLITSYTDFSLEPGIAYSYVIIARNRKGSVESPASVARTYSASPSGMEPPSLVPVSSTVIQATWVPPVKPNGDIQNYTLYQGNTAVTTKAATHLSHIVSDLDPWTEYTFRIEACTERGCKLSVPAIRKTLEAKPQLQGQPDLVALANQNKAHDGVLVTWNPPAKPNGIIIAYMLERRHLLQDATGPINGNAKIIYNGTSLVFTDQASALEPFSNYGYRVSAQNGVDKTVSLWTAVTTLPAPPDLVQVPTVTAVTANTIFIMLEAPSKLNGILKEYQVLLNESVVSRSLNLNHTVGDLEPFTAYWLQAAACTDGGCTASQAMLTITHAAMPTGIEPLIVSEVNATSAVLEWSRPASPNGEIMRYIVHKRLGCPPTTQPFVERCVSTTPTEIYDGLEHSTTLIDLKPYKAYEFQLYVENEAGTAESPEWVRTETEPDVPVYMKFPRLTKNVTEAVIDWTSSFQLNGRLIEYILFADGKVTFRGVATSHGVERQLRDQKIEFIIEVTTIVGQTESPKIIFDPNAFNNIGVTQPSVDNSTESVPVPQVYEEVWFIVLVCLIGVLTIFIISALCLQRCRSKRPFLRERAPLQPRQSKSLSQSSMVFSVDPTEDGFSSGTTAPNTNQSYPGSYFKGSGILNPALVTGRTWHEGGNDIDFTADRRSRSSKPSAINEDDFSAWENNFDSGWYEEEASLPDTTTLPDQMVFRDTHL